MKKLILYSIVLSFTVISCFNERIDGNGRVTLEDREVDHFDKVYAEGVFNVIVIQDDEFAVEVETDRNLQNIVKVKTRNNKLFLDIEDNVHFDATKMNIYVYAPNYEVINSDGVVNISSENQISLDFLEITNNGVGNIEMNVMCEDLYVYLNGVGNIILDGSASNLKLRHNGVGKLDAYDMPSLYVDIVNAGVGNSEIYVINELNVTISGVGSVYYRGDPEYINSTISGVGRLKQR